MQHKKIRKIIPKQMYQELTYRQIIIVLSRSNNINLYKNLHTCSLSSITTLSVLLFVDKELVLPCSSLWLAFKEELLRVVFDTPIVLITLLRPLGESFIRLGIEEWLLNVVDCDVALLRDGRRDEASLESDKKCPYVCHQVN